MLSNLLPKKLEASSTEFEDAIEELSKSKLEKLKTLSQLAQRLWAEINNGSLVFDRHIVEERALRDLSRVQVIEFANRVLSANQKRCLIIGVCGKNEVTSDDWDSHAKGVALSLSSSLKGQAQIVDSIARFKCGLSCYPSGFN